jgi:hypothetical protein
MSAPDLSAILEQLQALEPLIYAANDGQRPRAHFEQLLVPGFWEVGASGRIYTRDVVLDTLEARQLAPRAEAWLAGEHGVQQLAPDLYLFTYTLSQPTRVSRRASVWRHTPAGWQLVYHQGTVVVPG